MNPGQDAGAFDLVVIPSHDRPVAGDNILRVTGAPHRLTAERLAAAAKTWKSRLAHLPRPWVVALVGGATHSRPFPTAAAQELGRRVAEMAGALKGSILLATSRRTGPEAEAALLAAAPEPRHVFSWRSGGDNPAIWDTWRWPISSSSPAIPFPWPPKPP